VFVIHAREYTGISAVTHPITGSTKKSDTAKDYLQSEKFVKEAAGKCTIENK